MTALTLIGEPFPDWEQDLHRAAANDLAAAVGASAPRSCSARLFVARDREMPVFDSPRVQTEAIPMKAAVMPLMWQAGASARPLDGEFVHALTPMMPLRARGEDDGSQSSLTVPHAMAWEAPELMGVATARLYRAFVKRAVKYADVILTPTHATARVLHEHYGEDLPVQVLPLAPPSVLLEPADAGERRERLGLPERYVVTTATDSEQGRLSWIFDALRADPALPDLVILDGLDPTPPSEAEGVAGNGFSRAGMALGSLIRGRGGAKLRRKDASGSPAQTPASEAGVPAAAPAETLERAPETAAIHSDGAATGSGLGDEAVGSPTPDASSPDDAVAADAVVADSVAADPSDPAAESTQRSSENSALAYSAEDLMFIDPAAPSRTDSVSETETTPAAEPAAGIPAGQTPAAGAGMAPAAAEPRAVAAPLAETAETAVATAPRSPSTEEDSDVAVPADLRDRVHVVSADDLANVAAALAGAQLLLQPQAVSGTGYLLLAALAAEVPVLYAESEANAELTLDGGVSVGDAQEFAEALTRLAGDADELDRLAVLAGDRGRAFSWDGTAWHLWELHANL